MSKREHQELTVSARERIENAVRSLIDDRIERGVDLGRAMHCDSCDQERPPAGSSLYGSYKFCNDCLLDFTFALASGTVENVTGYMTRRSDEPDSVPSTIEFNAGRDRQALPVRHPRDKFVPGHEPV